MNSVALVDTLPWGYDKPPTGGRTILICDSVETDGRFLLHTIASQCLPAGSNNQKRSDTISTQSKSSSSKKYHIIWINCGLKTEESILAAMKKIGCDVRMQSEMIHILNVSLPTDVVEGKEDECLKQIYRNVSKSVSSFDEYVIIVDDISELSTFFGAKIAYTFVKMLKRLVQRYTKEKDGGLVIRASHDLDQENYNIQASRNNGEQKNVTGSKILNYIGAGGMGKLCDSESFAAMEIASRYELYEIAWERALVEIADGIVDVTPLPSGFAKDVHGRLVFSGRWGGGLGWLVEEGNLAVAKPFSNSSSNTNFSTTIVNFCCSDAGVRAIRLRV